MSAYPTIKPPESLSEALHPVGTISDGEFEALRQAVSGTRSFSLSKEQIEKLNKQIPATSAVLPFTLATLAYLYNQVAKVVETDESLPDVVAKLVDDLDKESRWGEEKKKIGKRLVDLFSKKETHQRFKKLQRLQAGFIPSAIGFSSFVDLRPDFNEGDPKDINGFLTIIQLRIATNSDRPDMREMILQLDEDSLGELKKSIDRLGEKIRVLKEDRSVSSRLLET